MPRQYRLLSRRSAAVPSYDCLYIFASGQHSHVDSSSSEQVSVALDSLGGGVRLDQRRTSIFGPDQRDASRPNPNTFFFFFFFFLFSSFFLFFFCEIKSDKPTKEARTWYRKRSRGMNWRLPDRIPFARSSVPNLKGTRLRGKEAIFISRCLASPRLALPTTNFRCACFDSQAQLALHQATWPPPLDTSR